MVERAQLDQHKKPCSWPPLLRENAVRVVDERGAQRLENASNRSEQPHRSDSFNVNSRLSAKYHSMASFSLYNFIRIYCRY